MHKLHILLPEEIGVINPNIYGHFMEHIGTCMYNGAYVGMDAGIENREGFRKDLIDALARIHPAVIRWPGGCFAENYDWRNGIGPKQQRPTAMNAWYGYDGRLETNQVGTHEFVHFCRMVGAEPYIATGVNCMTPMQIMQWMEYCNMPQGSTALARLREENGEAEPLHVKYWGFGNENWGSGGNLAVNEYSMMYHRCAAIAYPLAKGLEFIASGALNNDLDWTRRFFDCGGKKTWEGTKLDHYSVHYYTIPEKDADETDFDRSGWDEMIHKALYMKRLIMQQAALMDVYDPERKIGLILDEWGCWHTVARPATEERSLYFQQNTMRDAIVAALTLCIFNNNCQRVSMANIAQMVNCVHSLFLTKEDKLVCTPTYHVYDLMQAHQGGKCLHGWCDESSDDIVWSASKKDGNITVTLVNTTYDSEKEVALRFYGGAVTGSVAMRQLAADKPQAYNDFDAPDRVTPKDSVCTATENQLVVTLPAASVSVITCRAGT